MDNVKNYFSPINYIKKLSKNQVQQWGQISTIDNSTSYLVIADVVRLFVTCRDLTPLGSD